MNPNMLSFDEAYEKLLGFVRPVREVEDATPDPKGLGKPLKEKEG